MIKRIIRGFAVWLYGLTSEWVVSRNVWEMVDREEIEQAREHVRKSEQQFPGDPELTRLKTLMHFLNE